MKKVKILTSSWYSDLEKAINEFIEEHPNLIDIQYKLHTPANYITSYYAMIVYEDGDSN